MPSNEVFVDAFGRIREVVHEAVGGLTPEQLAWRADADANSIAWLVWHLTRVQDDHMADLAGTEQVWTAQGWEPRFALPFPPSAHGYGHSSVEVAKVQVGDPGLLLGYHDAVHDASVAYVRTLAEADYERIVDTRWDPPVTLAVRLVSVISDDLQHAGQAAFLRGLLDRGAGQP